MANKTNHYGTGNLAYALPAVQAAGVYHDRIEASSENVVLGAQRVYSAANAQSVRHLKKTGCDAED